MCNLKLKSLCPSSLAVLVDKVSLKSTQIIYLWPTIIDQVIFVNFDSHFIHPSIHFFWLLLLHSGSWGCWNLLQQPLGKGTLDKSTVFCRATKKDFQQLALTLTPTASLQFPVRLTCMCMDAGRKHREANSALHITGDQTCNLLAARQHCETLHHCAAR